MTRLQTFLATLSRQLRLQQKPATQDEGEPAKDDADGAPITRAIEDVRDTIIQAYERNQKEQNAENRKNRTIAKWAVAGAWIYATIAAFQYCKMREANNLTRQSINLSQAAIVEFRPPAIRWERNGMDAEFLNVGKISAFDVTTRVEFRRRKIADDAVLQDTPTKMHRAQFSVGTSMLKFIPVDVPLSLNPDANNTLFGVEYWTLNVSATYNDGFGDYRPYETCLVLFVDKPPNSTGWDREWRPCDDWRDLRKAIDTREKNQQK